MIIDNYPIRYQRKGQFVSKTSKDTEIVKFINYVINGWPKSRNDVQVEVQPYFNHKDDITLIDGLLLKGDRIIVPKPLQAEMRNFFHTCHLEIERNKNKSKINFILIWN